jgi:hypothetical protein
LPRQDRPFTPTSSPAALPAAAASGATDVSATPQLAPAPAAGLLPLGISSLAVPELDLDELDDALLLALPSEPPPTGKPRHDGQLGRQPACIESTATRC